MPGDARSGSDNFYCRQTVKRTFSRVSLKRKHLQGGVSVELITYYFIT